MKSSKLIKFLDKNKFICGISLILFFLFSESLPFGSKISSVPPIFSVNFFLKPFPFLYEMPMILLLIPSIIFLAIAVLPLTMKKIKRNYFLLFLAGFLFFPILYIDINFFGFTWEGPSFTWCILFLSFMGLSLLYKDIHFLYAAAVTGLLWDFGAAYIAYFWLNLNGIPTPYSAGLPPATIMVIDMSFVILLLILWWKRFDFFKIKRLSSLV